MASAYDTYADLQAKGPVSRVRFVGGLGHANVTATLDTYSHVLPHMQDGAVDAMDSSLS